jgi:predicted dehydrogenase
VTSVTLDGPIRVCMCGTGLAARIHTGALRGQREVTRTYASREVGRAKHANDQHRGAGWFGSYADALASDEVDAIAVLTPPAHHLELTLAALRAGKHVVVEKPPFMRAADFDVVETAARAAGRRVFVAENYYYKPLRIELARVLRDGLIGDPLFVHVNAVKHQSTGDWRDRAELSGPGALFEGGIHWVDFMANLGLEVRTVRGHRAGAPNGHAGDRSMLVTFGYAGGAVGTLAYSWEVPSTLKGLRISRVFGREGTVLFETNGVFMRVKGREWRLSLPGLRDIAGYKAMWRDFVRAWRTGDEPGMSLARARRDLELVEAAYATAAREAAQQGENA